MAQKKNSKAEAPKVDAKKLTRRQEQKNSNREKNQDQHKANLRIVDMFGIHSEETVKEIHTYRKKGKKVIEDTRTVVKQKRPSQLIRKYRRMMLRDAEGKLIYGLEDKVGIAREKANA